MQLASDLGSLGADATAALQDAESATSRRSRTDLSKDLVARRGSSLQRSLAVQHQSSLQEGRISPEAHTHLASLPSSLHQARLSLDPSAAHTLSILRDESHKIPSCGSLFTRLVVPIDVHSHVFQLAVPLWRGLDSLLLWRRRRCCCSFVITPLNPRSAVITPPVPIP